MVKSPRIISQCQRRRRRILSSIILGRRSGAGGAGNRVWSSRPDPGEHQRSGVLRRSLASPSKQRATTSPTEDEARGPLRRVPTQVCQVGTAGTRQQGANTFSPAPSPAYPHRPNTSVRHANLTAQPNPCTSAAYLRHHVRVSGHGTQPQRPRVTGHLHPYRRRGQHDTLIAAQEAGNLAAEGEATTRCVP